MMLLLSGIALCCLSLASCDNLFFSPQPDDVTAVVGNPASLLCGASESANISFYWTLDGQRVDSDTRRQMQGGNLYIKRVSIDSDIGEFKCVATNVTNGRAIVSRGAQINILWITDTVRVIAEDSKQLSTGDKLILRCKAEGNPEAQITWFRNGAQLYRDERISFKTNQLHVLNVTAQDNGVYSCKAVNDVGSVASDENFALKLTGADVPHIILVPRNTVARENGSATFECSYENAALVEWHFKGERIGNSSRYIIYPNGNLKISNVEYDDIGFYECKGISLSSARTFDQSYTAELQISFIDNMTADSLDPQPTKDQRIIATIHHPTDISCLPPNGLPKPRMWWEDKKGHVINDSGRVHVEDMRLVFNEVQEIDGGEYACVAENVAGVRRLAFLLVVSAPPVILKDPVDILINEGESGNFQCIYNKTSSSQVLWLKEEVYLRDTGNHIAFNENGLTVRNVGPSDSGAYQCEVNSEGFAPVRSKPASLSVKEKLKFMPAPVNRKLELGSNAKIYCKAGGSSAPVVKWSKVDARTTEWPPHIRDDNGTLHFNRVLSTDTGKYMCVATNMQGIINVTIDVDVIVMPKFTVQPTDTVANEGEPVTLHCLAEGDPLPIIQWDRNNELNGFNHNRFKVLENGSLFASEVHADDEGKYGCTAGNSGGLRRHEVSLTVRSKEMNTNMVGRGNEDENTMTKTVAITLGAAGVYIVLVVGLMMWCRYRRARRKAFMLAQATADTENSDVHDMELKDRTVQKANNDTAASEETTEFIRTAKLSHLLFPRKKLSTVMLLGHGEYGEVFLAKATGLGENAETVVMVKSLEEKNENIISEFNKEISMYGKMKHENVGTVLGLCQDVNPHYMILDYTDWGDLKQFLLATRSDETTKAPKQTPLSVPQILMICQQVAVGMEYISKTFTHKDLAARNCLISSSFKIKVSCPSLSLDTYSQEYHQLESRIVPLRWAPNEAIVANSWSPKSDVWAFGVLVWEVFSKAELPYGELGNEEVLAKLKGGELRLGTRDVAPESLVKLLERCWEVEAESRPSFTEAVAVFVELSVAVEM